MNYFYAQDLTEGYTQLFESKAEVKKGDYVVIPNYEDEPVTAKVTKLVNRYNALTANQKPQPIIDTVRIKEWKAQREKELDNQILISSMENKIKEIKLRETFEKYAGKDPEMLEMLKALNGDTDEEVDVTELEQKFI